MLSADPDPASPASGGLPVQV